MGPQKLLKSSLNPCNRPYSTLKLAMNPRRNRIQDGYSASLKASFGTVEWWTSRLIGKPGEEVVHRISDPPADQTSRGHGRRNGEDYRGGGNNGSADSVPAGRCRNASGNCHSCSSSSPIPWNSVFAVGTFSAILCAMRSITANDRENPSTGRPLNSPSGLRPRRGKGG